MKTMNLIIAAAAAIAVSGFGMGSATAQEFYPAYVSAIRVSTNSTGNLTYHYFRNRDLIRNCADETGLTNLAGLSLVYDRTADALDVVSGSGTNRAVVCTPLTFSGGTSLSNTNGTQTQRLAIVHVENSTTADGTLVALERSYTFTNGATFFSLNGQLQFTLPASGTNGPSICLGHLSAGSGFFDEFDEFQDR